MSAAARLSTQSFIDVGAGSSLEDAFDDAVTSAAYAWGSNGEVPSVGCCEDALSAGQVELAPMPTSATLARARAAEALAAGCEAGRVHALPVLGDGAFKRRKLNLPFEDPSFEVGSTPGMLPLNEQLEGRVTALLAEAELSLEEGEVLESVELRRVRARYKPVATPHPGRNRSQYVVTLRGSDLVLAAGVTAGAARREAVQLAKAGAVGGEELAELEISVRARREDGSPLASVRRERVLQKGVLRITLAREKNPEKRKVVQYVFYGCLAPESEHPSESTSSESTSSES